MWWRAGLAVTGAVIAGLGVAAGTIALLRDKTNTEESSPDEDEDDSLEVAPAAEEIPAAVRDEKKKKSKPAKKKAKVKPEPKKNVSSKREAAERLKTTFNPKAQNKKGKRR